MAPDQLVERMLDLRREWVPLATDGGRPTKVRIVRPAEADMPRYRAGVTVELLAECVDGWEAFTEADLLGPAIGSDQVVPFSTDVWVAYMRDHTEHIEPVARAVAAAIGRHIESKAARAKN